MAAYGSSGTAQPYQMGQDPRQTDPRAPPYPSTFPPSVSPQPAYPQYGTDLNAAQMSHQGQAPGHLPQQHDAMNGLAAQMGGMDVSAAPVRSHRKKERHAYHDIGSATAAAPGPPVPSAGAFGGPNFMSAAPQAGQGGPLPVQPTEYAFVNPADKLRMGEEA